MNTQECLYFVIDKVGHMQQRMKQITYLYGLI